MVENLNFKKLHPNAILPTRGSSNAAGLDLYSIEDVVIGVGDRKGIRTGISAEIPPGFYGRVAPRSGLAINYGIDVLGGVIDSDYRGEIICLLINHGDSSKTFKHGDRIAQLIIEAIINPEPRWVNELTETSRKEKGFGSTGSD
jgi:deoxyuridine 5'-triphosphate nucleotidohydrolase